MIDGKTWELEEYSMHRDEMEEEGKDAISNFLKDISDYRVVEEEGMHILYVR